MSTQPVITDDDFLPYDVPLVEFVADVLDRPKNHALALDAQQKLEAQRQDLLGVIQRGCGGHDRELARIGLDKIEKAMGLRP